MERARGSGRKHPAPFFLAGRAYARVAKLAPLERAAMAAHAVRWAATDRLDEARKLAGVLVDLARDGYAPSAHGERTELALLVRLAVDQALIQGDGTLAERRAVIGRLPLGEVAARALLLGQRTIAEALVAQILAADPRENDARLVELSLATWASSNVNPVRAKLACGFSPCPGVCGSIRSGGPGRDAPIAKRRRPRRCLRSFATRTRPQAIPWSSLSYLHSPRCTERRPLRFSFGGAMRLTSRAAGQERTSARPFSPGFRRLI